jgi:hypothetical protein
MADSQLMLDCDQRAALRRELAMDADGWTIGVAFTREDIYPVAQRLLLIAGIMDAIGWSEQLDAPDLQPIAVTPEAAAWARELAEDLGRSLGVGIEPDDQELEDLAVLSAIGGG